MTPAAFCFRPTTPVFKHRILSLLLCVLVPLWWPFLTFAHHRDTEGTKDAQRQMKLAQTQLFSWIDQNGGDKVGRGITALVSTDSWAVLVHLRTTVHNWLAACANIV